MDAVSLTPDGIRPSARCLHGMVTSPHALATQAGVEILRAGGNAADAGIAVAAALSVLYSHMSGLGGDAFFLYYDASERTVHGYNGSGAAARLATLDFYRERELEAVPIVGGPAASTVPGAVDAWFALHQRFGTMELDRIVAPAIAHAREGAPIARSFARSLAEERDTLAADEGARSLYAAKADYRVGEKFAQPALARSLERVAREGRAFWYEGDAARWIEKACAKADGPLRATDMAAHHGFAVEPLRARFGRFESLAMPPNSQGLALLIAQRAHDAVEGHEALPLDSAALAHTGIETIKAAFADRDRWVGDPRHLKAPTDTLLSASHAKEIASAIDPHQASTGASARNAAGDTTYFACVDNEGNALSMIQSLFFHFGSCVGVPELGIVLQNRGYAFTLDRDQPTSLAPSRLPFHTLMPSMLFEDAQPYLVYGSMGGEGQPQTGLQISIRIAERNQDPQAALHAPRWRYGRTWGAQVPAVVIERRVSEACLAGLRARGHRLIVADDWEESMGHAGAIVIDRANGVLVGASDPRSDGLATGW